MAFEIAFQFPGFQQGAFQIYRFRGGGATYIPRSERRRRRKLREKEGLERQRQEEEFLAALEVAYLKATGQWVEPSEEPEPVPEPVEEVPEPEREKPPLHPALIAAFAEFLSRREPKPEPTEEDRWRDEFKAIHTAYDELSLDDFEDILEEFMNDKQLRKMMLFLEG